MATVTGLWDTRAMELANASVIGGFIQADGDLILTTLDGTEINAGNVNFASGGGSVGPHEHTEYAPVEHTHTGFSVTGHTHSEYTQHIVLSATDPVPPGTASGTLIFRTA